MGGRAVPGPATARAEAPGGTQLDEGDDRPTMSSGNSTGERDPFAPPPADAPDRPWQPRAHQGRPEDSGGDDHEDEGKGGAPENGGSGRPRPEVPPPHPWSPGWQGRDPRGLMGPYQPGPQVRFDPNDPVQRRARYALLTGMWGLLFALVQRLDVALLLGSLALYWGISSLRGTPEGAGSDAGKDTGSGAGKGAARDGATGSAAPVPAAPSPGRPGHPQASAALVGLVSGGVALAVTATFWTGTLTHKAYYDCQADALTQQALHSCSKLPH